MLFNTETLEPLYKLDIGQPGSSFTFEVAKINGIPDELIEDAKSKLDDRKVKMDQLLNALQKEKNYLSRLNKEHIEAQETAQEALNEYTDQKEYYERKIKDMRSKQTSNETLIRMGKKMKVFIDRYNTRSRKKTINQPLMEEVRKFLAVERTKAEEIKNAEKLKAAAAQKSTSKKKKRPVKEKDPYNRDKIKVGSKVKLVATKQSGTVEEITGDSMTVTFGFARMKVEKNKLQWIQ